MKIKLHNKFEITINNKTYIAYNTLLKSVYEKIFNLSQYTSHIAIGTGLNSLDFSATKLGSYLRTFSAETEEIQSDVTKSTLFIKKVATIAENDDSTFSFSELGLTDNNSFDPVIFNHVLLTDSDGNPVSITRNQGDNMQIKVTIYLELSSETAGIFVSGENKLIKQILGENLAIEDNNLYTLRGENLIENKQLYRSTPDLTNAFVCEKSITYNNDNSIDITFTSEMGEGDLEEVLVCYDGEVCMRLNTLEINQPTTNTITISPTNDVLEIDKNVKEIVSVNKVTEEGEEVTAFTAVKYSKKLTDKLENLFDQNFTASTQKFIAKDGKMIAFISDGYFHMYKYEDYGFVKINTSHIPTTDVLKLIMFENIALLIQSVSPYVRIYHIENNNAIEQAVDLTLYNNSSYSFNWLDVDATLFASGKIKIGIIINNDDFTPVVLSLKKSSEGGYYDNLERPQLTSAKKVFSIYQNNFSEPLIGFLTDTYNGATYYFQEEFYENSSSLRDSSEAQYQLLANSISLQTSGRAILSQKTTSPHLIVYYYPDLTPAPTDISSGISHYCSSDGNYLIASYEDQTYKIFNFHQTGTLIEFENNFPSFVDQSLIKDFAFVGDVLLIFTDNQTYGVCIKNGYTRVEGLEDTSSSYNVTYTKYDLIGSRKLEGARVDLKLRFNK